MALVAVNGHGLIDGRLIFPRSGAWYADLRVDTAEAVTGAVTISIGDGRLVLKGTVSRGAEYADTGFVRVVAGADGLRKVAKPRSYNQSSLRIVLGDLLGGAGEKLAASADGATLSKHLVAWTTAGLSAGVALARALRSAAPAASWRALPDGTFWVGPETWPDSGLVTDDYQILDEDPRQLTALLGVEAPLLLPGTALAGRRVSRVEHTIGADGIRTWVWFEDVETVAAPTADRLKDALGAVVRASVGPVDYFACYWARVIAQSGSTIDVEIENPTISKVLPSMQSVPLTMPAPGATLQMKAQGRVLIGWSGGDPARPYALAPDAATALLRLILNSPALFLGDEAALPFPNFAHRTAESVLFTALAGVFTALATASVGPLSPLQGQFTAGATALTTFEGAAASYLTTKAKAT
jgi:uncharacterized protein YfiM (DUF2279 family)